MVHHAPLDLVEQCGSELIYTLNARNQVALPVLLSENV